MKTNRILSIIFIILICLFLHSCNKPTIPILSTNKVSDITQISAKIEGKINSDGGASIITSGICWNNSMTPTIENDIVELNQVTNPFTVTISQLIPNTIYYARAFAKNSVGTGYGDEVSFKTLGYSPTVTTSPITNVSEYSATCGGNVTSDGGEPVSARGVCWNSQNSGFQDPTIYDFKTVDGTGMGSFISNVTNLKPHSFYFIRAYATNSIGTEYGYSLGFMTPKITGSNDITFNPNVSYGTLTDIDGNNYKTVQIGTEVWMAENLKTTKLNDGTILPFMTNVTSSAPPAYCWYNNDSNNKNIFGALYNWYSVNTSKLCPTGWHVPNESEWDALATILGGKDNASIKMKEIGTVHWIGPNSVTTNDSGFTALPAGFVAGNMSFVGIEEVSTWWTIDERYSYAAEARDMYYGNNELHSSYADKWFGMSVRCVKD